MGLEDIVEKLSSKIVKPAVNLVRRVCAHPKSVGLLAGMFSYWQLTFTAAPVETSVYAVGLGFSAYYAASLVNDYIFSRKNKAHPKKKKSLVQKIDSFLLDNPKLVAPAWGISAVLINQHLPNTEISFSESLGLFGPLFYAGALAFFHCRKQNVLFKEAYKEFKSDSVLAKIPDFVFENPAVISSLAGLASFAYMLSYAKPEAAALSLSAFVSLNAAGAAYVLDTLAAGIFHSGSLSLLLQDMKISAASIFKMDSMLESKIKCLLKAPLPPAKKRRYHLNLSNLYFKQAKIDYCLVHMKEALLLSQKEPEVSNPHDFLKEFLGFNYLSGQINNVVSFYFGKGPRFLFQTAIECIKEKDFDEARRHLGAAVEANKQDLRFQIIQAISSDVIGQDSAADWGEILPKVIEEYEDRFESISSTSKEVMALSFDALLNDSFIFTRSSDALALKKEHDLSLFVFSCFADKSSIPKPYYFNKGNGRAYSIYSRMPGVPLAETEITEQDLIESLQVYFNFCFRTDAKKGSLASFSAEVPTIEYIDFYSEKFMDRIQGDTALKDRLFKNFLPVTRRLSNRPRHLIHGNYHPANIIKGDSLCMIDFGDACFANICLGMEQLLGHHLIRCDYIARLRQKAHEFMEGISKDEFLEDCAFSSTFVDAHMLGRSIHFNEGSPKYYRQKLVDAVGFLAENFCSRKDKDDLLFYRDDVCSLKIN